MNTAKKDPGLVNQPEKTMITIPPFALEDRKFQRIMWPSYEGPLVSIPCRLINTTISCGYRTLHNLRDFKEYLPYLLFYSKYPDLVEKVAGKPLTKGAKYIIPNYSQNIWPSLWNHDAGMYCPAEEFQLIYSMTYLLSDRVENLKSIYELLKASNVGDVTYGHEHHNGNYLMPRYNYDHGKEYKIGLIQWTWNGNILPTEDIKEIPFNSDGSAKK